MQKKLIALAIAGLASTAAFAQTNVTMYGIADVGYVNASGARAGKDTRANFSGIESGILAGSRIGFKGEEALGNGLRAVFLLEYALNLDTNSGVGTGSLASRQAYVGLAGNSWGQIALGRQYAPGYAAWATNDALIGSGPASPLSILNVAGGNTIQSGSNARINNAITYTTPNWSGFSGKAIYGYGEFNNTAAARPGESVGTNGFYGVGLNYGNGPLNLDVLYQSRTNRAYNIGYIDPINGAPVHFTGDDTNEWGIGGSYDFRVVKLYATYQDQKDNNGSALTSNQSNTVWSVGASVPVGNGAIRASYADLGWENSAGHADATAWALAYTHALSKRTTLYTTYTRVSNDRLGVTPVGVTVIPGLAAGGVPQTAAYGEVNNTFSAGINHAF